MGAIAADVCAASPLVIQAQKEEIRRLTDQKEQLRKKIQRLYKEKAQDQECTAECLKLEREVVQRSKDAEMSKMKQDCHSWCKRAQSAS